MKEALLYTKGDNDEVRCALCAHRCRISSGSRGICGVRENRGGTLYSLVYERCIAQNVDHVEKKPLFHFQPGSLSYSVATVGCNFKCSWCQNCEISQFPRYQDVLPGKEVPAASMADYAARYKCRNIAYTYTEPTVFFEYALDAAKPAKEKGLANIFVTNGYMTPEMLDTFYPCLDAANVDMKGFREETYQRYAGATLQPVLDSMKKMKEQKIWLEVTTLVVPEVNDDPAEARAMAEFMVNELGPETPWHLSRFFPANHMRDLPPTPTDTLQRFRDIGYEAGIQYVYLGNTSAEMDTVCHQCGEKLIQRSGFSGVSRGIASDGTCSSCSTPIPGVDMGKKNS